MGVTTSIILLLFMPKAAIPLQEVSLLLHTTVLTSCYADKAINYSPQTTDSVCVYMYV